MLIQVPIIDQTDVLIIGGTVRAVKTALELKKRGLSVRIASSYSFFGEDICATLDLQSEKSADFVEIFGTDAILWPSEIKRVLDKQVIDAGIDFLFDVRPVTAMRDAAGRVCGCLFAGKSGFHAVSAKIVADDTRHAVFSRMAGVPMKPFVPGDAKLTLYTAGAAGAAAEGMSVRELPGKIEKLGKFSFPMFEVSGAAHFETGDIFEYMRATNTFRVNAWAGDGLAFAHEVITDLKCGPADGYEPSPEIPVFYGGQFDARRIAAMVKSLPKPEAAGFGGKSGDLGFDVVRKDEYFRFRDCPRLPFELNSLPQIASCGIFVCGAGTAGAPAAISAAESGSHVICAENLRVTGGVMLAGHLGHYYHGNRVGFTAEMDSEISKMAPNPKFDVSQGSFDVFWKNQWFMKKMLETGVDMIFDTMTVAAAMDGSRACGAAVVSPWGAGIITSGFVVDASGNSDFAAAAGAGIMTCGTDEAAIQGAGQSPIAIERNYSNTDFTFILDSDVLNTTAAHVAARDKYTDSFDIVQIPCTRERRRIIGDMVLQPQDFFAARTFSDTITIGLSNFDSHGFVTHPIFFAEPPDREPRFARIPLRALLPEGLDGVAVTGLAVSAHRDCMPLIRMQPDIQNEGYAAGLVAHAAVSGKIPVRQINIRAIQKLLVKKGILPEKILEEEDSFAPEGQPDKLHEVSAAFANPRSAIPEMKARLEKDGGDCRAAMILAFLGDSSGRETIALAVASSQWDEGWNYKGMSQFGLSMSPLDAKIVALAYAGGDADVMLEKIKTLQPDAAFSHFRAVFLALNRHPVPQAAPFLEKLLTSPGMRGHAILTMKDSLRANRPDYNDNTYRNSQLKEIYLARALEACDPGSETAAKVLDSYKKSLQAVYCIFAGA